MYIFLILYITLPTTVNELTIELIIKSARDRLKMSIFVGEWSSLLTIIVASTIKFPLLKI